MKKVLLWMTAIALLVGCAKEKDSDIVAPTGGKTYTITANINNPETRTTAERFQDTNTGKYKYAFKWETGEEISVVPTDYTESLVFDLVDANTGTFSYTPMGGEAPNDYSNGFSMAVSPAEALLSLTPSVTNYDIYFHGSYFYGHSNAILVAGEPTPGPDGTQKFQFEHIAALVKVTYKNVPAGTMAMVFEADHNIKGTFHFTSVENVVASNTSFSEVEEESPTEAVVMFDNALTFPMESAEFFLPIPTGSYQTFQVHLVGEDMTTPIPGTEQSWTAANPFTLNCADVVACPEITLPEKGAEWSYTFTRSTVPVNNVLTLVGTTTQEWTVSGEGGIDLINYNSDRGNQFGTGNNPCTSLSLTTNFGTDYYINEIVLNTSGANDIVGTVSVSVGDNTFVLKNTETTSVALSSTATNYTFVSAGNVLCKGDVVFSYSQTSSKGIYIKSIVVNPDPRTDPQLSYAESSYSATVGESFQSPTISYVSGFDGVGLITYSLGADDDTDVASIDENTGVVTVGTKQGSVTVTASFPGNETYKPAKASYSLVVSKVETYDLFSGPIEEGVYLIVSDGSAMKASVSSNRFNMEAVTINENQIQTLDESIVWHITRDGSFWTIYNTSVNKYAASTSSNNQGTLKTDLDDHGRWTFAFSDSGILTVTNKYMSDNNKNAVLRRNGTMGFGTYAATLGTAPVLYKLSDGKIDPGISYNPTSAEVTIGDAFSQPTLNNSHNLTVSYGSNNTGVATVNNTASDSDFGKISVVGVGQAVITASWSEQTIGNNTYRAGSTTFTLTVKDASATPDWELVTDFSSIASGDKYMFVNVQSGNSYYMDASSCNVGSGTQCRKLSVLPTEVGFETVDAMCLILTGDTTNGFIVSNLDGKELFIDNTNNGLGFVEEGTTVNFYTDTSIGSYTLSGYDDATPPVIRYIGMNSTTNFRCYTSVNNNVKTGSFVWYHYVGD